jgi:hypothetical protein
MSDNITFQIVNGRMANDDEGELLQPRQMYLPPMTAETWRTMDEWLFRSLVSSNMVAFVDIAASKALHDRAKALGISLEDE